MDLLRWLRPRPALSEQEVAHGLRMMTWEGVTSIALYSVTTSGLLAAFALALGANSFQIGVMAAIPFIMQPFQIPTILLVERVRLRKAIAVLTWFPAQATWIPLALIPLFLDVPGSMAVYMLLALLALRGALGAVCNCAWFSWVRDLVPQNILGRFYSRRLALATGASIVFGLAGALFVDYWAGRASGDDAILGYTLVLFLGAVFLGMSDPIFMARMPEAAMAPVSGPRPSLRSLLATPFASVNFRRLVGFLFFWAFASNLAIPFFAVYMLSELEFPVSAVIALSIVSQLFNVFFLRVWGPFADRFGSKVVLSLSASLYLLVILGWAFTALPGRYFLTVPLIVTLQVFAGIASAGVNLTVHTLGYKLAPQGESTAYLVVVSLATSLGAGLSPMLGGWLADVFNITGLTISTGWEPLDNALRLVDSLMSGFDLLFILAFIIGIVTLKLLTGVQEEGEVERDVVLQELFARTRHITRGVNTVPGLRFVTVFPYSYLRHVPGMDVALGVTAYQIASAAKAAASVASHGETAAEELAHRMSHVIRDAFEHVEDIGEHGAEVVAHAARGTLHAVDELGLEAREITAALFAGAIDALGRTQTDPLDVFWGTGYGTIQGAEETGQNLGDVASQVVDAAQEAAQTLGIPGEEAAVRTAEGALDAAQLIGPQAVAQVKEALPERLYQGDDS